MFSNNTSFEFPQVRVRGVPAIHYSEKVNRTAIVSFPCHKTISCTGYCLKRKFIFLHIKPHNMNFQSFTMFYRIITSAVLRAGARCWSHCWLKTTEEHVHSDNATKDTINTGFKRQETHDCLVVFSYVPTLQHEFKFNPNPQTAHFSCFRRQTNGCLLVI